MTGRKRVHKISDKRKFDKYDLYRRSVQSPDSDVLFFRDVYRKLRRKDPKVLREDFSGTFLLSCEWVKLNSQHQAWAVDLDPEPLEYGKAHYLTRLTETQARRLHVQEQNVLYEGLPKADVAVAMNFSHFTLRTREEMKRYFANVKKSLRANGIFIVDVFGGTLCTDANLERSRLRGFSYYWEQLGYDPVTHRAKFGIHFRLKGKKRDDFVFSYDWRMWGIPELRDILVEVGFRKTHVYWEGTTARGEGDGRFRRSERGEACDAWVAYLVAEV